MSVPAMIGHLRREKPSVRGSRGWANLGRGPFQIGYFSRFAPGAAAPNFADPVVLLRAPYRLSFSYAGGDRVWQPSWHDAEALPAAVLLTVQDAVSGRTLPISRIAVIHVSAPSDSVCGPSDKTCDAAPADSAIRHADSGPLGQ